MTKPKYRTREHRMTRAQWAPIVDAGEAFCQEAVCLLADRWIPPGTPWDLAHAPRDNGYLGPAHHTCNRSEGATRGNRDRRRPNRWVL